MVAGLACNSIERSAEGAVIRIRRILTPIGSMQALVASLGHVEATAATTGPPAKLLELRLETAPRTIGLSGANRLDANSKSISARELEAEASVQACEQLLDRTAKQLDEYFRGHRFAFELPMGLYGTPFQLKVWEQLGRIGYSQTKTYSELAGLVGAPMGFRAVGAALGRNPLWVVLPCHRVIGKTGKLVGYAGGLDIKRYLVELEKKHATG